MATVNGSADDGAALQAGPIRILVIDDDELVRRTVAEMLASCGYEPVQAATPDQALALLEDEHVRLVVSDIVMPGLNGFELTEAVRQRRPSLPVLLITGVGTDEALSEALARGAAGLIGKPFTIAELSERVAAVLQRAERSEEDVRRRFVPGVLAGVLTSVLEVRDALVRGHCDRLASLAERLGERLGLTRSELDAVSLGALLHDIGKVGIPDSILLKPGALDEGEWAIMRSHADVGDRLLAPFPELADVRKVVRHHHEGWDGSGYPDGLAGDEIPLAARIVAVADAIEAMSIRRPYRDPLTPAAIVEELEKGRGRQWDPAVVDVALELILTGNLLLGTDGPSVRQVEGEPFWSDEDLGRFAERCVGDLVRATVFLDTGDRIAVAENGAVEGPGAILPDRRREALAVLKTLSTVVRPAARLIEPGQANGHAGRNMDGPQSPAGSGLPGSASPEVLEALDAAARVLEELASKRLGLHFVRDEGSRSIHVRVLGRDGRVVRYVSPAWLLAAAAARAVPAAEPRPSEPL
jgi:putative nucleotidyltransferase with HDIG domain